MADEFDDNADKPRLGAGDIEIELAGEQRVLKPTLRAFQALSRQHGGLTPVIRKIEALDIDVIAQVIALGLGMPLSRMQFVSEKIWDTGLVVGQTEGLASKCMEYVLTLMSGGRAGSMREDGIETRPITPAQS